MQNAVQGPPEGLRTTRPTPSKSTHTTGRATPRSTWAARARERPCPCPGWRTQRTAIVGQRPGGSGAVRSLSFACAMGTKSRRLAPYRRADPHAAGTCPELQAQGDVACSFGHISPGNEPYVSKVAGMRRRCLQFRTSVRRRRPRSVSPGGFDRIAGSGNGPFRVTIGSAPAVAREKTSHELEQAAISYHAIRRDTPPTGTIPLFIFQMVTIYFS